MTTTPQHRNPARENQATAAYNFVPLPERVIAAVPDAAALPDHDTFANAGYPHSGYFEVILSTLSPLYVRCPFTLQRFLQQEHKKDGDLFRQQVKNTPDFFYTSVPHEPVIPGSSLRGMVRALVEIAGYGKMSGVADQKLVYRAVGDPGSLGAWYREQMLGPNHAKRGDLYFDYPSPRLKGGYLSRRGGDLVIQPAQEHLGESFVHVEYDKAEPIIGGQGRQKVHKVYVEPAKRKPAKRKSHKRGIHNSRELTLHLALTNRIAHPDDKDLAGLVPAVLVESGHMDSRDHPKHMHCAIYEANTNAEPIWIPQAVWQAYSEDSEMTRHPKRTPRKLTDKLIDGQPLFYLLDDNGNLVFFGHTMMFRLAYERSIYDLIPEELRSPLQVDLAEALFGFVRQKEDFPKDQCPAQGSKEWAYAGRVSFTDGKLVAPVEDLWETDNCTGKPQPIVPTILSTPKPTSYQLYLAQPSIGPKMNLREQRAELSHYDSPKQDADGVDRGRKTVIRGHKIYWHQGIKDATTLREQSFVTDEDKQHTQFKPVRGRKDGKPDVTFRFRVYFENLSDIELGALCWALQPAGEDGKTYCHKLGMGKALGMGAIQLTPELHLTPRVPATLPMSQSEPTSPTRYEKLFDGNSWHTADQMKPQASYRAAFERHIWQQLQPGTDCKGLMHLPRIATLLEMMAWPGRSKEQVATQKLEDFKKRFVLPDPLYVASEGKNSVPAPVATQTIVTPRLPPEPQRAIPWQPGVAQSSHSPHQSPQPTRQSPQSPQSPQTPEAQPAQALLPQALLPHAQLPRQAHSTERPPVQLPPRNEKSKENITFITKRNKHGDAQIRLERTGEVTTLHFAPANAQADSLGRAEVTWQNGKIIRVKWLGF